MSELAERFQPLVRRTQNERTVETRFVVKYWSHPRHLYVHKEEMFGLPTGVEDLHRATLFKTRGEALEYVVWCERFKPGALVVVGIEIRETGVIVDATHATVQ